MSNPNQSPSQTTPSSPERDNDVHTHHEAASDCPSCGAPMKRNMFRTGSVQHPGRDMMVCTRCGTRQ